MLTCDNCGLCCTKGTLIPFTDRPGGVRFGNGGPCPWLTHENRCEGYYYRPKPCRDFELGCDACLELRAEAGMTDEEE